MSPRSKSDIVRSLFEAYRSKERGVVEELLADDFTFTSPYDDAIDRTTYFARCWPNSELIREHVLERIVENGSDVFVLYKCVTTAGEEFRNVELFGFDGDRVRRIEVYFGAAYRDGAFVKQ